MSKWTPQSALAMLVADLMIQAGMLSISIISLAWAMARGWAYVLALMVLSVPIWVLLDPLGTIRGDYQKWKEAKGRQRQPPSPL